MLKKLSTLLILTFFVLSDTLRAMSFLSDRRNNPSPSTHAAWSAYQLRLTRRLASFPSS